MKEVKISQVDALFANGSYPIEFLFGYGKGLSTNRIRHALRKLVSIFWPVFGEYKDGTISFDRYREEDCFDEETIDRALDIKEIEEAGADMLSQYRQKELTKLFFLKAIRFKDGLILIPKMSHVAGDGYSYFTFLSALAALSKRNFMPFKSSFIRSMFKPHHRRTVLRDFEFKGAEAKPAVPDERLTTEFAKIPRQDVQFMIREAASADTLRLSTNDILSAMAIKKLVEVQQEYGGEKVNLTIPIDVRRQVNEYGPRFFGNGIMLHTIELDRERIENSPVKETAARIRKSIPALSNEKYVNYLVELERKISEGRWDEFRAYDPKSGCLVTNLSKLPVDRLDFGTGGPQLIMPLTIEKNSTGILADKENYILRFAF